ncbi:MAG: BrnT family toxin, partial [Pyrinomonadaceae bacterium]
LSVRMQFEWDPKKAKSNLRKHRVSFSEASMVFSDVFSFTYDDAAHSYGEQRYVTLGMSDQSRVLVVAHTMRGEQVRLISARKATPRERRAYEEENK